MANFLLEGTPDPLANIPLTDLLTSLPGISGICGPQWSSFISSKGSQLDIPPSAFTEGDFFSPQCLYLRSVIQSPWVIPSMGTENAILIHMWLLTGSVDPTLPNFSYTAVLTRAPILQPNSFTLQISAHPSGYETQLCTFRDRREKQTCSVCKL